MLQSSIVSIYEFLRFWWFRLFLSFNSNPTCASLKKDHLTGKWWLRIPFTLQGQDNKVYCTYVPYNHEKLGTEYRVLARNFDLNFHPAVIPDIPPSLFRVEVFDIVTNSGRFKVKDL